MSSGKDQGTNPVRGTPSITPEDGIKLLSMQIDKGKGFDVVQKYLTEHPSAGKATPLAAPQKN